ncbi:hypothetical protein BGZ82_008334 [Podila clonocystis]|nr:hypothetical protein BGZ82_008334 [Podila clonocystis]
MDVSLQFSQMTLNNGNRSFRQREYKIITLGSASILYLIDRSPTTCQLCTLFPRNQERHDLLVRSLGLSFTSPLLSPPGQDELLIHSHVCSLLAKHAGLFDTRTYVLREMLEGARSTGDELMLLIMVDALIHRPTWLAGQEGSPQEWMSMLWRPLFERILFGEAVGNGPCF